MMKYGFPIETWNKASSDSKGTYLVMAAKIPVVDPFVEFKAAISLCPYCEQPHVHDLTHGRVAAPCEPDRQYYLLTYGLPYP